MSSSKTERDRLHNSGIEESYTSTSTAPWVDLVPGIQMQLLRASVETGHWSVLFKCAAGSAFSRHEHLGGGEYLMLNGKSLVRGGAEHGGVTAVAGDYGYEPNGMIHDVTDFPVESTLFFSCAGPLKFIDDDNNVLSILDWRALRDISAAGLAKLEQREAAE